MKVVQSIEEPVWRQFIEAQPASNIFHTPEMFQVFARTKGHRPTLRAVTDDGVGLLALLLPIQITLLGCLHRLTTRAVAYGSVLYAPGSEGQKALDLLLRIYGQEVSGGPLFTELRNLSNQQSVQPILRAHGFVYEEYLNYLIDLKRPPEDILQSIGRRTRKNIRRGLRQGEVVVEEVKERKLVGACYDLLCQSYQAAQVPLVDRSHFEAAFDLLYPKGMVRFTLARVDQTPVATSVELLYKDVVYGWYGGVDRTYSSYMPNELVMWHILRWGAENGYSVYDFGGAGKPDEEYGVRDFKAKFGGELVCFGRNICVHAPFSLGLSKLGYSIYRRLF